MRTKRGLLPGSAGLLLFCVAMSMQAYAIHRRNVVTGLAAASNEPQLVSGILGWARTDKDAELELRRQLRLNPTQAAAIVRRPLETIPPEEREKMAEEHERYREQFRVSLFLPDSRYVRLMSIGYDHFASDIFWIRSIQAFGGGGTRQANFDQLEQYFEVITDLDPRHVKVYSFANMILGEEAGRHEEALAILDKGIERNPYNYRLPYDALFYAWWTMKDAERAKQYIRLALRDPECPPFIASVEDYIDVESGLYQVAYEGYLRKHINYYNVEQEVLVDTTYWNMRRALDKWIAAELRSKAIAFHEEKGRYPSGPEGMRELVEEGWFLNSELPNFEPVDAVLSAFKARGEKIPETEEFLTRLVASGKQTGQRRLPRNPMTVSNLEYQGNETFIGYLVWPGQEPKTEYVAYGSGNVTVEDNEMFAIGELAAAMRLTNEFHSVNFNIEEYKSKHDGACPPELAEVAPDLNYRVIEPWGGRFDLDLATCEPFSTTWRPLGGLMKLYHASPMR